jgi:hypothetical protein
MPAEFVVMRGDGEYGTDGMNGGDGKSSDLPFVPLFPYVPYSLLAFITQTSHKDRYHKKFDFQKGE